MGAAQERWAQAQVQAQARQAQLQRHQAQLQRHQAQLLAEALRQAEACNAEARCQRETQRQSEARRAEACHADVRQAELWRAEALQLDQLVAQLRAQAGPQTQQAEVQRQAQLHALLQHQAQATAGPQLPPPLQAQLQAQLRAQHQAQLQALLQAQLPPRLGGTAAGTGTAGGASAGPGPLRGWAAALTSDDHGAQAFRRPEGLASQLARSLSAGVIMALALVHIIPDAVEELGQLPGTDFPVGGVCVLGGALLMVLLEHLAHVLHAPWEGVPTPSASAPTSPGGSVAGAPGRRGGAEGDVEAGAGGGACGAKLGCSCGKGCGGSWAWAWWPSAAVPLGSTLAAPGLAAAERRQGGAHVGAEEDELSRPLLLDAPEADGHVEALEGGAEHAAPVQAVLAAAGAPHAPQGQRGAAPGDAVVLVHAHPHEGCPADPAADHHHDHHQHQHDQHGEQGGYEGHSHSPDHAHTPQPATQHCHDRAYEHTAASADGALVHAHAGHPEGQSHALHAPCAPARSASAPAAGAGVARAAARAPAPAPSGGHRHVCVSHGNAPSLVLAAPDAAGSGPGGGGLRLRLVAIMLELGCVAHSLVIGLSIGVITGDPAAARALTIAIAAHQWLEGLGLGAVILQGGSSPARGAAMVVVYSLTAPLGIAVGMAAAASYDPASPLAVAVQGGLNGVAGGMLLYVALVQLIAEDLGRLPSPGEGGRGRGAWVRAANFGALLLGAVAMCVLALWA